MATGAGNHQKNVTHKSKFIIFTVKSSVLGLFNGIFNTVFNGLRGFGRYGRSAMKGWYSLAGMGPQFNRYAEDIEKLEIILSNPAALKVIGLMCDVFSMGQFYVYNDQDGKKRGKELKDDPALARLRNPNYMQDRSQWLWDYMFWLCTGNAYLATQSRIVDRDNAPDYWLLPHKMDWPLEIDRLKDKLIFSQARLNELKSLEVTYNYDDGTNIKIAIAKLLCFNDLSNGMGNWFKGPSRLDALYKIVCNSEAALDAKNINVRFSGKFLVSGTTSPDDVTRLPLGTDEKNDIESKVNDDPKQVRAVGSMVEIKRFVDDMKAMPLDECYKNDFFLIGNMFNIPRDVLEAFTSTTYENQEKAMGKLVFYVLDPKGEKLTGKLTQHWEYTGKKKIVLSWDHLPFVQIFEKDRVDVLMKKVNIMSLMLTAGIPIDDVNIYLDTNFVIDEKQREANRKPAPGGKQSAN